MIAVIAARRMSVSQTRPGERGSVRSNVDEANLRLRGVAVCQYPGSRPRRGVSGIAHG